MNPAKKNKKQTNKQTKASQTSIQDIQEMSATNDSQPVNKSSLLKRPNPENEIGETDYFKEEKIQARLNTVLKKMKIKSVGVYH